jgi:hypothetical protein
MKLKSLMSRRVGLGFLGVLLCVRALWRRPV